MKGTKLWPMFLFCFLLTSVNTFADENDEGPDVGEMSLEVATVPLKDGNNLITEESEEEYDVGEMSLEVATATQQKAGEQTESTEKDSYDVGEMDI